MNQPPQKVEKLADSTRIGELLVDRGLITQAHLKKAITIQARRGGRIGDILVGLGALGADVLRKVLSEILEVPAVDLDTSYGDPLVLDMVPKEKAFELKVIPLFLVENQLTVALPDPANIGKLDELRFLTGKEILPVLALEPDVDRHLTEYFGELDPWSSSTVIKFESASGESSESFVSLDGAEVDRPLVRLVNLIIARAVQEGASDIHLEPQESSMVVRYRIDGLLQAKSFNIPATVAPSVISRLKILSELDISEKRIPQDGKVRVRYRDRRVDVRTSTFPTIHGEKVVLRLLDKEHQDFNLDNIGMAEETLDAWRELLRRKEGILLVTGPTGSGKSSTLYATLQQLNQPDINIVTLEDPVEYELRGVSQSQVREQAGFTFAKGIRSILRQDPDVILVGEIRDLETAQIAVQAALTGHLVLSTLHTNDAPSAVIRLIDMGVPRFLVAASVLGILAQRLVRKVCPACVIDIEPPPDEEKLARRWLTHGITYRDGAGCEKCRGIGYKGRIGVYELVVMTQRLQTAISSRGDQGEVLALAHESGYRRMWWDGLEKVKAGLTTLKELLRSVQAEDDQRIVAGERGTDGELQEPSRS
jgi:type IV pilus assembly protein PilB